MRTVGRIMVKKKSGCVLNVVSVAGMMATPGIAYYSSSKAALINVTRTVAAEWGPSGVRVNALAPGWLDTEMTDQARVLPQYEGLLKTIPLGRAGQPEDIAGAATFLCSPAAGWITGSVLLVDGGQSTGSVLSL
jgi:NAD(P)-dependent dehydrogenase (short-subunit alcohol dehydrogenase family)